MYFRSGSSRTTHWPGCAPVMGLCVCLMMGMLLASRPTLAAPATKATSKGEPCRAPMRLETKNELLQRALVNGIKAKGWQKYVERETLAVSVIDFTDPTRVFYAGVNDNKMLYAASVPKIAILLAVVEQADRGHLTWSHELDKRLQNMIVASSNTDASWATDIVGLVNIEKIMRDPEYCFYDDTHGGLWVGRAYRSGGASNRDPRFNISHGATTRQVARFYGMLNHGKLVSPHWSFRILGLMSPPAHHHKFVGALSKRPGVVFLARKSGTWRTFHGDSALIQHYDRRFVLVGLSETRHGESIMRELAELVDNLIEAGGHRRQKRRTLSSK